MRILRQIAIQIYQIRNVNIRQQGNYALRLHLYSKNKLEQQIIFSLPISIVSQSNEIKCKGQIIDNCYITALIPIKFEQEILTINQTCLFRNQICFEDNIDVTLYCELLTTAYSSTQDECYRKCGQFYAEIRNNHCAQYFQIAFQGKYACVFNGTIHSICYKCQLNPNSNLVQRNTNMQHRNFSWPMIDYTVSFLQEQLNFLKDKIFLYQQSQLQPRTQRERKKIFQNNKKHFETKIHKLAGNIYELWNLMIKLILKNSKRIIESTKKQFRTRLSERLQSNIIKHQMLSKDWTINKYEDSGNSHQIVARKIRKINKNINEFTFIDRFLNKSPQFSTIMFKEIFLKQKKAAKPQESSSKKHLIILVHGFGACRIDMQKISISIKKKYMHAQCLISNANQCKTEGDIEMMGQRLYRQVNHYITNKSKTPSKISFIGHSMGGIIIRSALPKLQAYSHLFYSFITFSTPHLGYLYGSSKIIDAGLWIMNSIKNVKSLTQLVMEDSKELKQTFMYNLSQQKGFQWFKQIALLSSSQDCYVPYESARIQKTRESIELSLDNNSKAIVHNSMVENLVSKMKCNSLQRLDLNFWIQGQNIDNFIGRTAHIKFLNCQEFLSLLTQECTQLFI